MRIGRREGDALDDSATDDIEELIDENVKFYKQISDDADFGEFLLDWPFERYQQKKSA